MSTLNAVDQICEYLEHMCHGHLPKLCFCENHQSRICDSVRQKLINGFELVREGNRLEDEWNKYISELVFDTMLGLSKLMDRLTIALNRQACAKEEVNEILGLVKVIKQYYVTYGCHDTKVFFEKNEIYDNLKSRTYRTCCVCGVRRMVPENSSNLKDAVEFKDLLVVEEHELENWLRLKYDNEDEIGAESQECYHIAFAKGEKLYYHILDYDETSISNEDDSTIHPLIKNGKLSKLPSCEICFDNLRRAHKFLLKHNKCQGNSSDVSFSDTSSTTFSTTSEMERDDVWTKAIKMLKPLSFKRCDVGRIPKSLRNLNSCGRTAIAPFVAFTKVKQLRSSVHLPGSGQSSTSGSKFSVPSERIIGKEFYIPLTNNEFIKSYRKKLPRSDVAVRHRIFFLGNLTNWKSMESTLNKQNRGQSFDVQLCSKWLDVLKRTGALSSEYVLRRGKSLAQVQRKISRELAYTTTTTDSSVGVVLEDSKHAQEMDNTCTDDIAAARWLVDNKGVKTQAPGLTSSLFWNQSCNNGKVPVLKTVLKSMPGKQQTIKDTLLLKLKRHLPNEFS